MALIRSEAVNKEAKLLELIWTPQERSTSVSSSSSSEPSVVFLLSLSLPSALASTLFRAKGKLLLLFSPLLWHRSAWFI